jgi:hypothetical protein
MIVVVYKTFQSVDFRFRSQGGEGERPQPSGSGKSPSGGITNSIATEEPRGSSANSRKTKFVSVNVDSAGADLIA